jgi:Domain of unknown function (DUF4440)
MRRFLLHLALNLTLIGIAYGQGATQTKMYPIPGTPGGATAEYQNNDQLQMLDDFARSRYLEEFDHALLTNDKEALDRMIADNVVWVSERFGKGESLAKAGVLASFGDKKVIKVSAHTRDHVHLRPFGKDTIVMTGNSSSILTYQDRESRSNRLFANVYMKLDGRWQCIVHTIMDYDGLLPGSQLGPATK